ncbi:MAG: repeat-associated core protein [Planctomycetaceae bacterium]|nr:repeat-associated core protein [Planctomycetaceae bacterium]
MGTTRTKKAKKRGAQLWTPEALEERALLTGNISGVVFNDLNSNGVEDVGDPGLAGWTVFIDTNADGHLTPGEPVTATDTKGKYTILGLTAGAHPIFEVPQAGFSPTPGFTDHQTVTIRDNQTIKTSFPNVTAAVTTGQISGSAFIDANLDGIKEAGEKGLTGWTLFVDTNHDGNLSAGEPTAISDADGGYTLTGVPQGSQTVIQIPQGGYAPIGAGLFPLGSPLNQHAVTVTAGGTVKSDFADTFSPVGTIQGTVWNDANGDGIHEASEAPLAGRTVYIDLDNNGVQDATDPARITDANGAYSFANILTGTYRVVEVIPTGMISADNRASTLSVGVFQGGVTPLDFYNLTPTAGSVSGVLWNDLDGNGVQSASEAPLPGWQVFVDQNGNGSLDAGEANMTTDASGTYSFPGLAYGNVTIRDVVPATWTATNPIAGASTIHLLNGENRTGLNFGNRERIGTIQGTVWNDANGDRVRGASESGLANWTVFLDLNNDGIQEDTEPSTLTASSGSYSLTRVPVGTYSVVEVMPSGWITSEGKPSTISTALSIGSVNVVDFYDLTPVPGTISGTVWNDTNSNGFMDAGEPGLEGSQVYVDINGNGVLDATDPQATTDSTGSYTISGVPYGTTTIHEVVLPGDIPTNHPTGAFSTFVLNGENRVGVDFGNHEPLDFSITGTAFSDTNKDGIRDPGETGLSGITVFLDTNNNGILDPAEPSTTTSVDLFFTPAVNEIGTYSFTHLARGTYHVIEIVPAVLEGTPAAIREQTVSVGTTSASNVDYADQYRANEIHGVIFDDTNDNHIQDPQEYARPGVSVYIDSNRNDVYDPGEPETVSGADGTYSFANLTPGAYIVREDQGAAGPHTYPMTGGGILWPTGVSNPSIGNVTPTSITTSLAQGETYNQTVTLTLPGTGSVTNLVDVFLLFDDTGSFTANSPIVRAAFPTIISTLQASLPGTDLGFGVGRFEEYGNFASELPTGRPFILNQPIVAAGTPGFSTSIQAALDRTAPGYGGDIPETDIEALYQLVTGQGFDGNNNGSDSESGPAGLASTQVSPGNSGDVPDFASFTPDPATNVLPAAGNVGGGGFRPGALPIVLLATDTGFAYQPQGETTITGTGGLTLPLSQLTQSSRPTTPYNSGAGIQQTVTGLNALGALVIGLGTNAQATIDPRQDLEALSDLTGAVNRSTTTIANGTADPIAPGDPMYFQIGAGFGSTVADGVVNAIQNAVTNVAMDITVRASDPRVQIINHTGTLLGIGAGQTASFDIQFTGDGRPERFDLQFVRAGTNVVLGSIPVVLGTPVVGEGYEYDELNDGEIDHSSHFGNYVADAAPTYVAGADQTVAENSSSQSIASWATSISAGPATESNQTVDFIASNDNPGLFSVQPTVSPDGTLTFTPAPNASGSALVTLQLHDNGGIGLSGVDTSVPQTFLITVTPVVTVNHAPVATDDSYAGSESTPLLISTNGVLGNDVDPDGDALTAHVTIAPAHGTLTLNIDGTFAYAPTAGYVGTDSFTYVANDGALDSNVATVNINVAPVNHAPVATDDSFTTLEDTSLNVGLAGVLSNDVDFDGDPLTVRVVGGPAHGTLTLNTDGSFLYVPDLNFNGTDSFTYLASDGTLNSNVATATITVTPVDDAPVAVNDVFAATEDTPLNSGIPGVLLNDSDVDGDALSVVQVSGPAHGTLSLNANGSFLYTPALNFNGTDSFTYQANDGSLNSNIATVTLVVAAVNDAPVAVNDVFAATEDTPMSVVLRGVMGNDSDVDGDTLTAILVSAPAHGTLSLSANGSFVYSPALNFNGTDSFIYKANDGALNSNVATVTITVAAVNDAPVAGNDSYSTNQNVTLNVSAKGLLLNDTDVDGDPLAAVLATGPAHGTLAFNSDGSFTYTPAAGFSGADSFTYRATDSIAQSGVATVSLTVVPFVPATKFFVADADRGAAFQYVADGTPIKNTVLNKSDSKPRGIASNSTGTVQWVIDSSGAVFVYDNSANLLGTWTPQNVGKPEGITVSGNDLWLVDPNQDKVFFFSGGANLRTGKPIATSSFALNSGNLNSTDIVTDGSHLWVLNDTSATDKVFRYTTGGVLEGSWTISTTDPSPSGITLDPTNVNNLWIVDASTRRVYQYDGATGRLSGSQDASVSFALAATDTNPQGIADPMPVPSSTSRTPSVGTSSDLAALDTVMGTLGTGSLVSGGIQTGVEHHSRKRHHGNDGAQHHVESAKDLKKSHGHHEIHDVTVAGGSDETHPEDLDQVFADLGNAEVTHHHRRSGR